MRWRFHLAAVAALSVAACLYWLPPWKYGFYPRCPLYQLTHFQCPGCGMTRALAALFHGQLTLSWHYNPLAMLLLPPAIICFGVAYRRVIREGQWIVPRLPRPVLIAGLVALALFGIGRNLHLGLH